MANGLAAQGLMIVFDWLSKLIGLIGVTGDAFGRLTPHVAVVTCSFLLGAFALTGAFFLIHRQQSSYIDESRARHDVSSANWNSLPHTLVNYASPPTHTHTPSGAFAVRSHQARDPPLDYPGWRGLGCLRLQVRQQEVASAEVLEVRSGSCTLCKRHVSSLSTLTSSL